MRQPAVSGIVSAKLDNFLVLILLPSRRSRNDVNNYWDVVVGREVVICRGISRCLFERCRVLAQECRIRAQSFQNEKSRLQMFQLADDYERKAIQAADIEASLRAFQNRESSTDTCHARSFCNPAQGMSKSPPIMSEWNVRSPKADIGQKQIFRPSITTSALPPKADMRW